MVTTLKGKNICITDVCYCIVIRWSWKILYVSSVGRSMPYSSQTGFVGWTPPEQLLFCSRGFKDQTREVRYFRALDVSWRISPYMQYLPHLDPAVNIMPTINRVHNQALLNMNKHWEEHEPETLFKWIPWRMNWTTEFNSLVKCERRQKWSECWHLEIR